MTASKKFFNVIKTTIHRVIVDFPVFTITRTLWESKSGEYDLKPFLPNYILSSEKAVFLLKNADTSKYVGN